MVSNPTGGNTGTNDDPFLIQEDAKVFSILMPPKQNLSRFEEVSGLIAFARYSLQKHQFVIKYQQEHGQPPPEAHMRSIILSFNDENSVALLSLKQQSEILLRDYAKEYLENTKQEEIIDPIEKIVKKYTNFWSSVGASLISAVVYSFVVAIIIFTATVAVPNTKFAQIIRILIEEQPNPNSKTPRQF